MALEPSSPPAAAVAALHRALADRASRRAFSAPNLLRAAATPHALSVSMPHLVAYLPLEAIERGLDLRDAVEYRNWRFLVHEKRHDAGEHHVPIAAATAAGKEVYELGEVNEGPFVAGTVKAIAVAEQLEEVRKGRFEAFFLIVPAVYVAALWLQNLDGGSDIILTIPPSSPGLSPYKPVSPREFIGAIHRLGSIHNNPYAVKSR